LNIKGIVGLDALHDLALLQLGSSSGLPLPVAPKLSVNVGDAVYAIGNPRGLEGTFSQGVVSSVHEFGSDRVLQITAPISPGSSGGPVLDQTGTVVGVSVASVTNRQNLNFAIPADYVTALQKKQTELRPFKGVPRAKPRKKRCWITSVVSSRAQASLPRCLLMMIICNRKIFFFAA
jgi:S1-C subfamily serine protease